MSPANDKISVVVPIYAGEQYLECCVESILNQTHTNLEIILVNDGSPDQSGELCDRYANLDRRVRVIHQTNSGLVSARRAGVAASTGKYLGFVDGDDWIAPDFYENMSEIITSNDAGLVIGGHIREFMGKHEIVKPKIPNGVYDELEIEHFILPQAIFNGKFFQHGISTYVWNKLFLRESVTQFIQSVPDEILVGEDAAITYPYLWSTSRVVIQSDCEYFYRQRPRSILKSFPAIESEYKRLSVLFGYLAMRLRDASKVSRIIEQLQHYFLALVLMRAGGLIRSPLTQEWFSAFPNLTDSQRIVVCSSGSFGQHLVNTLERVETVEIVGWIDDDAEESQVMGLAVSPLDEVLSLDFDLLVIASIDPDYSDDLERRLRELGLDPRKISRLKPDFAALESTLQEVGFDLETFTFTPH